MISQQNPAKPSNSTDPQFKEPKYVCIIGAGFSGLRAAECLMNRGFEVTIVEACSHIGGRLCQSNALSLPVACGAVDSICDSQGRWLDRDRARNPYREGWDVINRAMAKSRTKPGTIHESVTTMDHFRQLLETRRGASDWAEPDETLMLSAAEMWKSLIAEDCHKQSLRHLLLDEGKDGEYPFLASTFQNFVKAITAPARGKASVRLNTKVRIIKHMPGRGVMTENDDESFSIVHEVIVTAPLGWLKRNQAAFMPPLPAPVATAIQELGYGNIDRVFIRFPAAFWDQPAFPQSSKAKDTEHSEAQGACCPVKSLFLKPAYAMETNPSQWQQEMISLSALAPPHAQPTIVFSMYGEWARHITALVRGMSPDSSEYRWTLERNFRPYYSKLPHYSQTNPGCHPVQLLATDWANDELAGSGLCTNQAADSGDTESHIEVLRRGMGEDRGTWFAGEHTAPRGEFGTVNGAYKSGEEVARRLCRKYGIEMEDVHA